MDVEIVGAISEVETIAVGDAIREIDRLTATYGAGRWRKLKGKALIRRADKSLTLAELHGYEAHGKGRKEFKIKSLLDDDPEVKES